MDNKWQWALRVTPALGLIAVVLILIALDEPERGQSEGSGHMEPTPWTEDVKDIVQNRSFMFSTAGFTCVAFVAGALAWWGPTFIEMGIKLQDQGGTVDSDSTRGKYTGPEVTSSIPSHRCPHLLGGHAGVCSVSLWRLPYRQIQLHGHFRLRLLRRVFPQPHLVHRGGHTVVCCTANKTVDSRGFPVTCLSEAFIIGMKNKGDSPDLQDFKSLQYALFSTCFVEVIGGLFFLITAFYIVQDKKKVEEAVHGKHA
nr:unnamed protein product [Callosobruchus analis]